MKCSFRSTSFDFLNQWSLLDLFNLEAKFFFFIHIRFRIVCCDICLLVFILLPLVTIGWFVSSLTATIACSLELLLSLTEPRNIAYHVHSASSTSYFPMSIPLFAFTSSESSFDVLSLRFSLKLSVDASHLETARTDAFLSSYPSMLFSQAIVWTLAFLYCSTKLSIDTLPS